MIDQTLDQTLEAVARLRDGATKLERDLHRHVAAARDPATAGRLHRLHRVVADMCLTLSAPCRRQAAPATRSRREYTRNPT
jgi:hypothetical protein